MIYFNQHDYTNAISAFKKVIAEYPASEEAKVALESLETIYVNTNKVDEYAKYAQTLGKDIENKTSLKVDSMQFVAGEKLYLEKHYTEAIEQLNKYLMNQYPNGKYCNTALYYLADCYYEMGNKDKALEEYALVLEERGNPHAEEAALRAAEISFDNKDYEAALRYFHQLSDVAQTTENKNIARLGVLRTSYFLNNMEETVKIASEIIADSKSTAEMRNEALLNRSKAYLQQNKPNDALKDLKEMSIDTRTSVGAEAKYTISEVYFKFNRLNDAEKEILDFAKIGTSFPYWMARSFILLSDIYQQKGDDFQAKQYLLSLQKNYTVKDEIQDMIITRLNQIEKRGKERIVK
jgi:TolA-binding protein